MFILQVSDTPDKPTKAAKAAKVSKVSTASEKGKKKEKPKGKVCACVYSTDNLNIKRANFFKFLLHLKLQLYRFFFVPCKVSGNKSMKLYYVFLL